MKKYQICILELLQICFIIALLQDITKGIVKFLKPKNLTVVGIISAVIVIIFIFIFKKFWRLRKYLRYKLFALLNLGYILNLLINLVLSISSQNLYRVNKILNIVVLIFLIGNIILILTYNRNLRKLKNKEGLDD